MTFEEYLYEVREYKRVNPVRMGQAFFNCLPDHLAKKYGNTCVDPFHNDELIANLLNAVYQDFQEGK